MTPAVDSAVGIAVAATLKLTVLALLMVVGAQVALEVRAVLVAALAVELALTWVEVLANVADGALAASAEFAVAEHSAGAGAAVLVIAVAGAA
jgi:hypothetical protein